MSEPAKTITREELYKVVWSKPLKTLAKEWNTTYLQLVKACQEMNVPRPDQGHWQRLALGQAVAREQLPEQPQGAPSKIELMSSGMGAKKRATKKRTLPAIAGQQQPMPDSAVESNNSKGSLVAAKVGQVCSFPQAAEGAVLDMIRQATRIDFWKEAISHSCQADHLRNWMKLDKQVTASEASLVGCLKRLGKEYRSFQVKVDETADRYCSSRNQITVEIRLKDGFEWKDAVEEAWSVAKDPNPHCLSDNALRLHQWARGPKNTGQMMSRRKIGAQARLRGTYYYMEDHLREIRLRANSTISWEEEGQIGEESMRIWFEKGESVHYQHGPLNPALGLDLRKVEHHELERFKTWLHAEILKPGFPEQTEIVGIFDIRDRNTVKTAFSGLPAPCGFNAPVPRFFDALRLVQGVQLDHSFLNGPGPWLVTCEPEEGATWKEVKRRLRAQAKEISLEKKYSLSADSAALLRWILNLRDDEYLLGMTPPVENHLKTDIGLQTTWRDENMQAYLELLIEEITQKTEFNLRTIAWKHYGDELTRLLVKKKHTDLEGVVRSVQLLGLSKDRLLSGEVVRKAISHLVAE